MDHPNGSPPPRRYLVALSLSALGVVYGDIGTSPLYAVRECFFGPHSVPVTQQNILGVLSLIFWTLVVVVSLKYHIYVIRADNRGEGGILALMALVRRSLDTRWGQVIVVAVGLFGAALLYGDGIITPAISVLGAIEGLDVATPVFGPYVVWISIAILVVLFVFQRKGTAGIGSVFGPVMLVWFATIATLGVSGIIRQPSVLGAINPWRAVDFFLANGFAGFLVLGAVFLVATGGEALYADLGHFGHAPVQIDWFLIAGPSLLLNYFGQGALLLSDPEAAHNPFYRLAPEWALYPLVVLATAAAVIASQAIISGSFSLTRQAVQLGYLPRVDIVHTSATEIGQIYIPGVNWALMAATIAVVMGFRSSSGLANAYGVAVTTTMVITTVLAYVVTRRIWGWSPWLSGLVTAAFLFVDLAFFAANIVKIEAGGWFPLIVAAAVYTLMATWKRGRELLFKRLRERAVPLELLLADIEAEPPARVPGTAVFMTPNEGSTPHALVHNLTHNKVLHEQVLFLSVRTEEIPVVAADQRVEIQALGNGFYWVVARYGFMQDPSVPDILERAKGEGLEVRMEASTFFLGRETLLATERPGMARWREKLFAFMSRNAVRATAFFRIPPDQVFEVGVQVEL